MLNQVTRALAALIKPISSRAVQTDKSSADRDAMGQAYENLHQQKEQKKEEPEAEAPQADASAAAPSSEKPSAQVIPIQGNTPEEIAEARKKAIGVSQAWVGLMTSLEEQKANAGDNSGRNAGPSAYEKAGTGMSKAARAKKGIILDKKAA